MSVHLAVGSSDELDDAVAAASAVEQALGRLGGPPRGALVYATAHADLAVVLARVSSRLGELPLIGCTGSGLIAGAGRRFDDGVVVVLFGGDVRCAAEVARGVGEDSSVSARAAAARLSAALPGTRLIFMHPEPLGVDGRALVRGVQAEVPGAVVVGGNAGEFTWRTSTRQFFGREVLDHAMPLLGIAGAFEVSVGCGLGWKPIGRRYRVTGVEGRRVYRVDDQPVLDVLRDYRSSVGVDSLTETPLAVYPGPGERAFYLRAVERVDHEAGCLVCVSAVSPGAEFQLTMASVEEVLGGAQASMTAALARYPGARPAGALVFSCTTRQWVLGARDAEEAARLGGVLAAAGADVPLVGFYAHGEIAPSTPGAPAEMHNHTCVSVLIGD
jgi:hypothetical protein